MATPDFTKTPIVDEEEQEARYRSAADMIDETKARLLEMGLEEYPQPKSRPIPLAEIPNIDSLTNTELGVLFAQYTAYAQFVGARSAEMQAMHKIAVSGLKRLTAEMTAQLVAREVPKSEIPAQIRKSQAFIDGDTELLKIYAMKTMLEAVHRAYEKQAAALSRLISLRELEFQQTLRDGNIKKPRRRPGGPSIQQDLRGNEG